MPRVPEVTQHTFCVLGVCVDAVQIPGVVRQMENWIAEGRACHCIAFAGLHGVSEAKKDSHFRAVLNSADLVVPDGMPLVWLGRLHGRFLRRRVYGPELMETFCRETGSRYRHFFYGAAAGVAQNVAARLQEKFHIVVAGACSPPFGDMTEEEDKALVDQVHEAAPDILWISLGAPKQERWMQGHRARLHVPVLLGVGAAFDIQTGKLRQAPEWMRENGLEWLFRLLMEPRRLWKRYLINVPRALWSISLELIQFRKFD